MVFNNYREVMNKIRTFNLSTKREIKYRYHDAAKVVFVFDLVPTIFSFFNNIKKDTLLFPSPHASNQ